MYRDDGIVGERTRAKLRELTEGFVGYPRALVVPDKAQRGHNFHRNTVHALAEMVAAMGLDDLLADFVDYLEANGTDTITTDASVASKRESQPSPSSATAPKRRRAKFPSLP